MPPRADLEEIKLIAETAGPIEIGPQELIGVDETTMINTFTGSKDLALGESMSGLIRSVCLSTTAAIGGTGSVLTPAGVLMFFTEDPEITLNDPDGPWLTSPNAVALLDFAAATWHSDAGGGCYIQEGFWPFIEAEALYVVWFHEDVVQFNSVPTDDERMLVTLRLIRTS